MMNEENKNLDAGNPGNPKEENGVETITSLKEEVARLKEENDSLAEKLKKSEYNSMKYKDWWMAKEDEYTQLFTLTKELIKFSKLT